LLDQITPEGVGVIGTPKMVGFWVVSR